jgi:hypothetical protein
MDQAFQKERFARAIEETSDVKTLREIAKTLLAGWMTQRAATNWIMRQAMSAPVTVTPDDIPFDSTAELL